MALVLLAMTLLAAQEPPSEVPAELWNVCSGENAGRPACRAEVVDLTRKVEIPDVSRMSAMIGAVDGAVAYAQSSYNFVYCNMDRHTAARAVDAAVNGTFEQSAVSRKGSRASDNDSFQVIIGHRPTPDPQTYYWVGVDLSRVPTRSGNRDCRLEVRSVAWRQGVGEHQDQVSAGIYQSIRAAVR